MKLPYFQDTSDCRALCQTHQASAWRSDGKYHSPATRTFDSIQMFVQNTWEPFSQVSFPFISSTLNTSPIINSHALILYNIIMQYSFSYRRLYFDKGRILLFELCTKIHAATCISHLWFHSISYPLFVPAGFISAVLLCSFASPFFTPIHFSASAIIFFRSVKSGCGHGPKVAHPFRGR